MDDQACFHASVRPGSDRCSTNTKELCSYSGLYHITCSRIPADGDHPHQKDHPRVPFDAEGMKFCDQVDQPPHRDLDGHTLHPRPDPSTCGKSMDHPWGAPVTPNTKSCQQDQCQTTFLLSSNVSFPFANSKRAIYTAKHDAFLASFGATSCINRLHILLAAQLAATSRSYCPIYGVCF